MRKQQASEEDWNEALAVAPTLWPWESLEPLVEAAVLKIQAADRPALAWSGGKDSIALAWLYQQAFMQGRRPIRGFSPRGVNVLTADLEYPEFERWMIERLPAGVEVERTPQTWEWLAAHPDRLFPASSGESARWFSIVQHRGQDTWQKRNGGTLVLGRRADDGNRVPLAGHDVKRGVGPRLYPIRDWTREQVLALIAHKRLPLPPIYDWPRGWRVGTGPWAKRRAPAGRSDPHALLWSEIDLIDPTIRERARHHRLPGA